MNETLKVIKNRYSCRNYTDQKVEQEKIEAITLVGVQAPSSMNQQAWKIVVVRNKDFIDEMDQYSMEELRNQENKATYERMMSRGGKLYYNAPCIIYVLKEEGKSALDCGIVVENMALAATSLGLGNVICGMARIALQNEIFASKIIPEGYEFATSILIGYTDGQGQGHEVDLSKIVYVD